MARNRAPLIAALAFAAVSASAAEGESLRRMIAEEPHMGVIVRIEAYVPREINPAHAFRAVFDRVAALEQTFSSYRDDSEVRRVEDLAWRESMSISAELSAVLEHALTFAKETGGAFDPTLGRVTRLLRQSGKLQTSSVEAAIAEARSFTGWRSVEHDASGRTVFLRRRGVQLDFGGIAKGYIADEALRLLNEAGVARAMVAVAGDIAVSQPPPDQPGWPIALDAVGPRGTIERQLLLRNQAVSTSGSRERFYEALGKTCSHVLTRFDDPCTDSSLAVSVVAPSGMQADGLATALLAMGSAKAGDFLRGRPEVRAYWAKAVATTTSAEQSSTDLP